MHACDTDFDRAARLASRFLFSRASGAHARPLVRLLLSNRTLGPGERRALAELITGALRRRRGNPPLKRAERERREAAVLRVAAFKRDRKARGLPRLSHDDVINAVAAEMRIRVPSQLAEWVRTAKHRK